jgi:hypothetical protein
MNAFVARGTRGNVTSIGKQVIARRAGSSPVRVEVGNGAAPGRIVRARLR